MTDPLEKLGEAEREMKGKSEEARKSIIFKYTPEFSGPRDLKPHINIRWVS